MTRLRLPSLFLVSLAACSGTVNRQARELLYLEPDAVVLGTWRASAAVLFPHLVATLESTFPEARLAADRDAHVVRFWYRESMREPARAAFALRERTTSTGTTVSEVVMFPLRTSPDFSRHPRRYPPAADLLRGLRERLGAAMIVRHEDAPSEGPTEPATIP